MIPFDIHDEWLSLIEVSGPFLATPVLKRVFSTGLPAVEPRIRQYLRQAYDEWCEARDNDDPRFAELHRAWIYEVLARGLEYDESYSGELLLRAEHIPAELRVTVPEHGVTLAPDYALVSGGQSQLLIQIYPAGTDLQAALKIDGWIASPAERMERLCRTSGCRLGLVTDGERWMLVDASVGAVSTFASWYARLWGQERLTLQAFLTLLGIRRFFGPDDESLPSMLDESIQHQEEVTDALGEQVRRAVEMLIQALDKEDRERSRALLKGIEPTELYEAGLTIMMRLVFLLSAEERGLLLMGEEAYESNYAISTLRMQLRQETEEVLERRNDAWSRLLATFRAVYGGIEHEALRLPALGGSIFDPDRFPFLEGRAKGSNWKVDSARPIPIDNRTVLLLLEAIQQYEGRTLSYRALDVEQIGYVYEGLLERTVARTERVTVELTGGKGAKKTLYALEALEVLHRRGEEALINELSGADAIKRSAGAIRKDLERPVDAVQANRLLTACAGDEELRDRALPFLSLLRTDSWGYPLIYPQDAFIITTGSDRRETGTHYTPKSLTEQIVENTLEPVVYVGPSEGRGREQWQLKSPAELLDLKICDPAMGSGAFLVQVCRWLAERIADAWAAEESVGRYITIEGVVVDDLVDLEGLPANPEDRLMTARRLVAERCLYGVDLNPLAVELAKLSIWLVTLAKGRPFGFLDHNLKCGDSLLGIHRLDQLTELSMMPSGKGQQRLFGRNVKQAVREAIELRVCLREIPIRDIHDVEAMARLDADARQKLKVLELIADAFIGEAIAVRGNATALERAIVPLTMQAGQAVEGDQGAITAIARLAMKIQAAGFAESKLSRRPFHWPLEFPEVFSRGAYGFNAIIGNPPFLGGQKISGVAGDLYREYLVCYLADGIRGSADLVSYFFNRAFSLLAARSTAGLIAVKTIAEGDTRDVGLTNILSKGASIYSAVTSENWPGKANVVTSRVIFYSGEWGGRCSLNGGYAKEISSSLSDRQHWEPIKLVKNKSLAFQGSVVLGMGFVLDSAEAIEIIVRNPEYVDVLFPYLIGQEVNQSPSHQPGRWVIQFWDWPEDKARKFGELFVRVESLVKPERQLLKNNPSGQGYKKYWWLHGKNGKSWLHKVGRGGLFHEHPAGWTGAEAKLNKVLVFATGATKYPCFTFVPNTSVFANTVGVVASESYALFSCLSSDIHAVWAWERGSKMKQDLRYTHGDIFETLPFPDRVLEDDHEALSAIGRRYFEKREMCLLDSGKGLTKFYNDIHDQKVESDGVVAMRALQMELNETVLSAYGFDDLDLKHGFHKVGYLPEGKNVRFTISETARVEIIYRLSELNRKRSEEGVAKEGASEKPSRSRLLMSKCEVADFFEQSGFDFDEATVVHSGTSKVSD